MRNKTTFALLVVAGATALGLAASAADPVNGSIDEDVEKQAGPEAAPVFPPEIAAQMAAAAAAKAGGGSSRPDFPKWDKVSKDYKKVISVADGHKSMYTLWTRKKDAQLLMELPPNFGSQKLFIAFTVAGGTQTSGVQTSDMYAYWKRFDKRLALIEPNYAVRTTGDLESKKGRERVFTDRVILDVPIVTMGPGGGPVIDGDAMLLGRSNAAFRYPGANASLARIAKAKAFPKNVEIAFELPLSGGRFGTLHYSISVLPAHTGYKPRKADARVGFFTTTFKDIGHPGRDTPWVRYVNRWNLEKADPKLRMSPPKQPIVFYLEHTIPVRYRRWVRDGVLEWNKAFEKVGIVGAIEVYQQDARTGAHMEKDPEDARFNFVLWTNANMGFAIGPSRVDPRNGQILDADIVMDEGFITSWVNAWRKTIPETAMVNFGPETLAWLAERPQWDPRVRLASPAERRDRMVQLARQYQSAASAPFAGHPAASADPTMLGDDRYDGLGGRISQVNGRCEYSAAAGMELALFRLAPDLLAELAARRTSRAVDPDPDPALSADDPVSGIWDGEAEVPEMGAMPFTLELKLNKDDNTVTGQLIGDMYSGSIEGSYDPDTGELKLTADVGSGVMITFDLTLDDGLISGTATAGDTTVNIQATRSGDLEDEEEAETGDETEETGAGGSEAAGDEKTEAADDEEESADDEYDEDEDEDPTPTPTPDAGEQMLDGIPEWFIGPMLKDVIMHEVGHTLGLRHNFRASTIHSLAEMNSEEFKGRPITGSVMDYNAININFDDGEVQGEYTMVTLGPYDLWAIEYGYTFDRDLKPILARVSEPELIYGTDEDSWGSDPFARTFDLGRDPLDYCESQARLVRHLREKILDRMVKDGDSWAKARRAYEMLLSRQFGAVSIAANFLGGAHSNRDMKGDPGDRLPVTPVALEQQQRALAFVIENAFSDDAYGLTPDLLARMSVDKWWDEGGFMSIFDDPAWPVHDRILGLQASALTMILNPTTLNRVYDNEFRIPADEAALTLPEVLFGVTDSVWSELDGNVSRRFTDRKPMISSLRRNLQREHLERLIDLSLPNPGMGVAAKPIANLSVFKLREIGARLDKLLRQRADRLDSYTLAHFAEARVRIEKALEAQYIYNAGDIGGGGGLPSFFFGREGAGPTDR